MRGGVLILKKVISVIIIILILTSTVFAIDHDDPRGKSIVPNTNIVTQQK